MPSPCGQTFPGSLSARRGRCRGGLLRPDGEVQPRGHRRDLPDQCATEESAALRSVAYGAPCVTRVTALPIAGALSAHEATAQEGMLEKIKANITKGTCIEFACVAVSLASVLLIDQRVMSCITTTQVSSLPRPDESARSHRHNAREWSGRWWPTLLELSFTGVLQHEPPSSR